MGQTLSEPVTTKESSEGGDARVLYGASSMQGWRISKCNRLPIVFTFYQYVMLDCLLCIGVPQ